MCVSDLQIFLEWMSQRGEERRGVVGTCPSACVAGMCEPGDEKQDADVAEGNKKTHTQTQTLTQM